MARTYRRFKRNKAGKAVPDLYYQPWWSGVPWAEEYYGSQADLQKEIRDCGFAFRGWTRPLKEEANYLGRAYTRRTLHRILVDDEFIDNYTFPNKFGNPWHWD